MIGNVSVSEELANKNRELYLNKLTMDLDSNLSFLSNIINNTINILGQELIGALLSILNSNDEVKITKIVNDFFDSYREAINNILTTRYNDLKTKINLDDYVSYINSQFLEEIKKYYLDNCSMIINEIKTEEDFTNNRLDDYLQNIFYNKFLKRIIEFINDANNLLINNYNESLARYKLMNEKTFGSK